MNRCCQLCQRPVILINNKNFPFSLPTTDLMPYPWSHRCLTTAPGLFSKSLALQMKVLFFISLRSILTCGYYCLYLFFISQFNPKLKLYLSVSFVINYVSYNLVKFYLGRFWLSGVWLIYVVKLIFRYIIVIKIGMFWRRMLDFRTIIDWLLMETFFVLFPLFKKISKTFLREKWYTT